MVGRGWGGRVRTRRWRRTQGSSERYTAGLGLGLGWSKERGDAEEAEVQADGRGRGGLIERELNGVRTRRRKGSG